MNKSPHRAQSRIERQLLAMLGDWWPEGTRIPPTTILAQWLGTGQRNTHQALRELTRRGFLTSRRGRGTYVLRVPDGAGTNDGTEHARRAGPRQISSTTIAIVALEGVASHPSASLIAARCIAAGAAVEHVVLKDAFTCDLTPYARHGIGGMVLIYPEISTPVRFDEKTCLAVLCGTRTLPIEGTSRFDFVAPDEAQGSLLAGRLARKLGSVRPCFVGREHLFIENRYDETSEIRLMGFEDGFRERLADHNRLHAGRYAVGSGKQAAAKILRLDPLPDFVFAVSDELAIGIMEGTAEKGVRAGRDYMLLGFDGFEAGRQAPGGPISSLQRPEEQMANLTADYLLDRLANPDQPTRRTLLGCSLFHGATTGQITRSSRTVSAGQRSRPRPRA